LKRIKEEKNKYKREKIKEWNKKKDEEN